MAFYDDNLDMPSAPGGPEQPQTVSQGSTALLEREEAQLGNGDSERFAHIVRKERLTEAMILGKPVIALCGKVWIPSRNPDKFPMCPTCKNIYDNMGGHDSQWPLGSDIPS